MDASTPSKLCNNHEDTGLATGFFYVFLWLILSSGEMGLFNPLPGFRGIKTVKIAVIFLLVSTVACNRAVLRGGLRDKQPVGLILQLKTDRDEYAQGEPISLVLTVTNSGSHIISLSFPSSQIYDFVVRRQGKEIWRWSGDRMFAAVLTELKLNPGESRTYPESWSQVDEEGKQVTAGSYELTGMVVSKPPVSSPSRSIRIH